tara:strand:- start:416 stop:727 length:312 start_codon:yes stop_codon:yes gene_type:complete
MTDNATTQAWEFREDQYSKAWAKVDLTGRRRVTHGNPNYENGTVVEYEVKAGLYGSFLIESNEIIFKEYYLEDRWVSESKIKILDELTVVTYKSDGTAEKNKG